MLDVHPPHHAATTWRDFFIHIATIVVGLLIAIGLEQTVEFFHHRHQVAETREALRLEREENIKSFGLDTLYVESSFEQLENDMLVLRTLQQQPGTQENDLPGAVSWSAEDASLFDSAWKTAQQTQVTALMPRAEVTGYDELYQMLHMADDESLRLFKIDTEALRYHFKDPDLTHLTPAELDREIDLTEQALEATYRWGVFLENVHDVYPEFSPAPPGAELNQRIGFQPTPAEQQRLRNAIAKSQQRLQAQQDAITEYRRKNNIR